jgi:hypothetical protein
VARASGLASPDGSTRPTIFAEMTALAQSTGAANLGQGFPDGDGPEWIREIASAAIRDGANQYPPGRGIPELRQAIAAHQLRHYGIELDPEREVLVTAGATEAIAAAVLAFAGPGDEVVTLEPFYDSYAAAIAMAGAAHVTVPLVPGPDGFRLDSAALDAAVSERTRLILLNTPHNPTGTVLSRDELQLVADAARRADALLVTDEVYEHLTFDGDAHTPVATLPGMAERTLTISSAGSPAPPSSSRRSPRSSSSSPTPAAHPSSPRSRAPSSTATPTSPSCATRSPPAAICSWPVCARRASRWSCRAAPTSSAPTRRRSSPRATTAPRSRAPCRAASAWRGCRSARSATRGRLRRRRSPPGCASPS